MELRELIDVLWRRKLIVLAVALLVVGAAIGALRLVTPIYESTATLVLRPEGKDDDFSFFYALDAIVPIYSNAATTRTTYALASEKLGRPIGAISVQTFKDTPIITIRARDPDPAHARNSARVVSETLIERVEQGGIGVPSLEVRLIDQPEAAVEPVFPRYSLSIAVAILLGSALGMGAALLRENLTNKVETSDDLANLAGVPCYAEIPAEPAVRRLKTPEVLTTDASYRPVYESLRDLRTNLRFSNGDLKSILVTSPEGRHGKTTVSFGLAVSLARAGSRTLLVDGDLRRGRIAELLGVEREPGLIDVLGGASLEEVIKPTSLEMLDLLTGGKRMDDPGELLQTEFPNVLRRMEELYEVIVIDSTPLIPVNDARIIASFAESTVVVASAESVTRRQVRKAIERLNLISVAPTAVVLNNSKFRPKGYYT